jgi:hypothetical protein
MKESPRGKTVRTPPKSAFWAVPLVILGGAFFYGSGSALWYRYITSPANDPASTETCKIGSFDAEQFRGLIRKITADGARGGGNCYGQANEAQCFEDLMRRRIDTYAEQIGSGAAGRITAMHALMRANKAVLLTEAVEANFRSFAAEPASKVGIAYHYALDTREIGLSAPSLGTESSKRRSLEFDAGRTRNPGGRYAIAEVTIKLVDPAHKGPDGKPTGPGQDEISYVEAAWSHRRPDAETNPVPRPELPAESVHEMVSKCPFLPAWAQPSAVPPSRANGATADEERKQFFDFIRKMQ